MYKVTVKADYRWNDAQVGGKVFSKKAIVEIAEADMTEEILNSPLLEVVEVNDAKSSKEVVREQEPQAETQKTEGNGQKEGAVLEGVKTSRRGKG